MPLLLHETTSSSMAKLEVKTDHLAARKMILARGMLAALLSFIVVKKELLAM